MHNLTDKQEAFCIEYMKDFNGTQAAIRAGYKENAARQTASENLSKPVIQERLAELKAETLKRNLIEIDDIVQSDANIVHNNWMSLHHFDGYVARAKSPEELTDHQKSIITGIQVVNNQTQYVIKDQDKAKERLMKYMGGYEKDNEQRKPEKIEVEVNILSGESKD